MSSIMLRSQADGYESEKYVGSQLLHCHFVPRNYGGNALKSASVLVPIMASISIKDA